MPDLLHIETMHKPALYSPQQIQNACIIAKALRRGKLCLCVEPARKHA